MLNGGLADWDAIERELAHVDGVMLGRVAYHDPYVLAPADWQLFGDDVAGALARGGRARAGALRRSAARARRAAARDRAAHARPVPRPERRPALPADPVRRAKLKNAGPELLLEALAAVEPQAVPA